MTLLALISSLPPACANPAPIGSPGSALVPFSLEKLPGVSIVEEKLTIRDGAKGKIPSPAPGGGTMDVPSVEHRATYKFDNQTGKPMTVRVGFPVIVYSELAGGSYGGFTSLSATYDKTKLPVKELSIAKPTIFPTEKLAKILKDLKAARAVRSVAESPDFVDIGKLGNSIDSAQKVLKESGALSVQRIAQIVEALKRVVFSKGDETPTGQSLVWSTFEIPLPRGLSKQLSVSYSSFVPFGPDYSFSYILTTGRFWNHQIRHLRINIEPDQSFLESGGRYEILPKGKFSQSGTKGDFTFESRDQAPEFDILVRRIP